MDDKMNIEIEVNVDIEKALKDLDKLRRKVNSALREFRNIEKKLKSGYILFDKTTDSIAEDVEVYRKELSSLERAYKRLKDRISDTRGELWEWNKKLQEASKGKSVDISTEDAERKIKNLVKRINYYEERLNRLAERRSRIVDTYKLTKGKPIKEGVVYTIEESNKQLKTVYDTLKSTKATRMDKNLQLFTASIFEGIMEAFDEHLSRAMGSAQSEINEITVGRRLAGMAVKPEQFYLMLLKTVFGGNEKAFAEYMKRFGVEVTEADYIKDKSGATKGISVGVDPLKVIRDLALRGGKELELSSQFRTGLAQGLITNLSVGFSSLTAKIGIIGVILKKIYEVMEKMVGYSGVMSASLKLLTTIVQLSIKPVADIIGSMVLPILLLMFKALMPILRNWNKVFSTWMRATKERPELTAVQIATTLVGLSQGSIGGAFAGALVPMMATYFANQKSGFARALSGMAIFPLMSKMLGGGFLGFPETTVKMVEVFGKSIAKVTKTTVEFGKAMVLTRGAVAKNALASNVAFKSLVASIGSVVASFAYLSTVLLGFYELFELTKSYLKGEFDIEREAKIERQWKFDPFGVHNLYPEVSSPEEIVYKSMEEYQDIVGKHWEAMAKYYPSDEELIELQKLSENIDTSEFDVIIENVTKFEQEFGDFSNNIATTGVEANKYGDKVKINIVDLFKNINTPVSEATDYWIKHGDDLVSEASGLHTAIVRAIDEARRTIAFDLSIPTAGGGGGSVRENIKMYQSGGWVTETGLAIVHEGEYVVPREHAFEIADILRNKLGSWERIEPVEMLPVELPIIRSENVSHVMRPIEQTVNIDVSINVDHVSSDVDIDRIAEEVGRRIYREMIRYGG